MSSTAFAVTCSIIGAVLFALLVTITFRTTLGRIIAYLACAVVAVAPLFGRYAVIMFAVAGLVMIVAVVVGRRVLSRQEHRDMDS